MRKIDYHMHTCFSGDSEANPREHIKQAVALGLDEICFTDHRDFDYPIDSFELDVEKYFQTIMLLKEEYKDQIIIKWGIEIGLDMNYQREINELINQYPFDFIIGSIHVINHTEFYYGDFFNGLSKEDAHRYFFEETLKCIKSFDCFNILGHLDYIMRYGPYEDKKVEYDKYQDIIDEIFKTLIAKGKGIEINTSGYAINGNCGFPSYHLVKRYYDLGGRIITIGTDSHTSDRVGQYVNDVIINLKKIGFKDVTTFTKENVTQMSDEVVYIFLDVDGVLNNDAARKLHRENDMRILSDDNLNELSNLVNKINKRYLLILISTWRYSIDNINILKKSLNDYGLSLFDYLDVDETKSKGKLIIEYCRQRNINFKDILILDDAYINELSNRLVKCNFKFCINLN